MQIGDYVRVTGWGKGIAFQFCGHPKDVKEFWVDLGDNNGFWETDEYEDDSRAIVVMVGDDRKFTVDTLNLALLNRSDFCGGCGQIGHNCED